MRIARFVSRPASAERVGFEQGDTSINPRFASKKNAVTRVAIYLDSLQGYGADKTVVKIIHGLVQKGIQVDLVLAKTRPSWKIPAGVRLFDLKSSRINVLKNVLGLARYLHQYQPDILFSSIHFNNVVATTALVLSGAKSKLIVRQANTNQHQFKNYPSLVALALGFCTRLAYKRVDLIISQSEGMTQDITGFMKADPQKVRLIYNPTVTPDIFEQAQQPADHAWFDQKTSPIILAAGRLKPQKDFVLLLKAFANVKQSIPDARLVILGEGPQRQELEELALQLGIRQSVDLAGFRTNPYAFIAMADIFVLSSQYEGLPNILIEALALGKRIISTDCESGPVEILKHGRYGTLVPVGDLDQMTEAMKAALSQPSACLRIPEATEDFRHESQVEKYVDVFCSLINQEAALAELTSHADVDLAKQF